MKVTQIFTLPCCQSMFLTMLGITYSEDLLKNGACKKLHGGTLHSEADHGKTMSPK